MSDPGASPPVECHCRISRVTIKRSGRTWIFPAKPIASLDGAVKLIGWTGSMVISSGKFKAVVHG